jgi:hypothetical protein
MRRNTLVSTILGVSSINLIRTTDFLIFKKLLTINLS